MQQTELIHGNYKESPELKEEEEECQEDITALITDCTTRYFGPKWTFYHLLDDHHPPSRRRPKLLRCLLHDKKKKKVDKARDAETNCGWRRRTIHPSSWPAFFVTTTTTVLMGQLKCQGNDFNIPLMIQEERIQINYFPCVLYEFANSEL